MHVVAKRQLPNNSVRYEVDRSLTGTAHESYLSAEDASGDRTSDLLARRIFATGSVSTVHIFSNLITVKLSVDQSDTVQDSDSVAAALDRAVEDLFIHYHPGVLPTAVDTGADV